MKSDVNVTVLPADLPETLRTVIRQCLQKNPKRRIRDVGDVSLAMEGAFETAGMQETADFRAVGLRPLVLTAIAASVLTGVVIWGLRGVTSESAAMVTRLAIPLGTDEVPTAPGFPVLAVSPAGDKVVYQANRQLFLRRLEESQATLRRSLLIRPPFVGRAATRALVTRLSQLRRPPQTSAE